MPNWTLDELILKFIRLLDKFKSNNGCQWARKGSKLDKKYIIPKYNKNFKKP